MASIRFFTEGIQFRIPKPRKTANWIQLVVKKEKKTISFLNFIFCNDKYLSKINVKYLGHKDLTDIITFEYSAQSKPLEADIFISIPRVKENARNYQIPFGTELSRVLIHGVLHLLGYSDKTASGKAKMRKKEDAYLSLR